MHHDVLTPAPGGPLSNLYAAFSWLAGNGYAPHRGCFLGDMAWVTAYVAANWVIALAYILVALLIAQRMRRAAHIPRTIMGMALLGIFVTCAIGHFLEGLTTLFWPGYRLETIWHWVTALPAWLFLANHNKFSLIVEGPHMIAETREELSRKNAELLVLYDQVKETDSLKSAFFANVSHELRTPLTLILGPLQNLLASENLTSEQKAEIEVVAHNARTVLKHVNDLLDISRMEAGRMRLKYVETDMVALTRVVVSLFDNAVRERRQTLTVEAPGTLVAQVDPDKMQRILLNLISNAVKFVPEEGTIVCRLRTVNTDIHGLPPSVSNTTNASTSMVEAVEIEIQDNGPGIPAELREAVFERFRQVDSTMTRRYEGTGLGLAIVRDFVELHGGDVYVTEAPGGGAIFRLRVPLSAPAGVDVHHEASTNADVSDDDSYWYQLNDWRELVRRNDFANSTPSPSTGDTFSTFESTKSGRSEPTLPLNSMEVDTSPNRSKGMGSGYMEEEQNADSNRPMVLIVEDNRDMSAFISRTLAPAYRTVAAYDGDMGAQTALALHPDLILSDLMMPNRSGDQMVNILRAYPELADTPIILLTAKDDEELRIRLLKEGAQDYLTKPFSPEELRARVRNLVSIKRARHLLQSEISTQKASLESLASEVAGQNRALRQALIEAQTARTTAEEATERTLALQDALAQRNTQLVLAVHEIHHRVKNNLQVVTALLELKIDSDQIDCVASRIISAPPSDRQIGVALPVTSLQSVLRQIKSISLIHNMLDPDTDYTAVDLATVVKSMQEFLTLAMIGTLSIRAEAESLRVHIKVGFAIALIVNELVELLVNQYKGRANARLSKETVSKDVILIQLHPASGNSNDAVLSIEVAGPQIADLYGSNTVPEPLIVSGNNQLDLVLSIVECDLQGTIKISTFSHDNTDGADEQECTAVDLPPGSASGIALIHRVEIVFPKGPASV